eukprot:454119-Alexandrium_andersonii.AAC.1
MRTVSEANMHSHPQWQDFEQFCGRLHHNVRFAPSLLNFQRVLSGLCIPLDKISAGSLGSADL